jgi:hypothetical protein
VLVRVCCTCLVTMRPECPICLGRGYFDKWLPYDLLPDGQKVLILNKRDSSSTSTGEKLP